MTTFSTPTDYAAMAALIKNDLAADRHQRQHRRRRTRSRSAPTTAPATFDWDLTGRGMRGDVDGYVAEYNPSAADLPEVVHAAGTARREQPEADLAPRRQRPDHARHEEAAADVPEAQQAADGRAASRSALVSVSKFFVVNKRLKNIYVAFTDFNPALRTAYIVKLDGDFPAAGRRVPARRALLRYRMFRFIAERLAALVRHARGGVGHHLHARPAAARKHPRPLLRRRQRRPRPSRWRRRRSSSACTGSYPDQYWRWISGVAARRLRPLAPDPAARVGHHEDRASDRHRAGLPRDS